MTGYGKASIEYSGKKITLELKSLNSKQFDWNAKIPYQYRGIEADLKSLVSSRLERGKIDLYIGVENNGENGCYSLDENQVKKYYNQLKSIAADLNETNADVLSIVMRIPDVMRTEKEETEEEELKIVLKAINSAVDKLDQFRINEGAILEKDIHSRILSILQLLKDVEPFEVKRIDLVKERLKNNLTEFFDKEKVDQNRFEQEMIYYLEKLDITEEKIRLKKHCDYFFQILKENSSGKKMGFVCQEIGREINTLGSKANDFNIQSIVIQMKDELEKVKEQLLNIL